MLIDKFRKVVPFRIKGVKTDNTSIIRSIRRVMREDELRDNLEGFNRELMDYLIWYNTERIHSGIGGKAPLDRV